MKPPSRRSAKAVVRRSAKAVGRRSAKAAAERRRAPASAKGYGGSTVARSASGGGKALAERAVTRIRVAADTQGLARVFETYETFTNANKVPDTIRRDVDSSLASGQVLGTPTLFIDGVLHRGGYDPPTLLAALAS